MAPRLFHIHPCLVISLMVIIKVKHSFLKIFTLATRLFYIHLYLWASIMVMFKVDYSSWEGVILTPRLFYICPPFQASHMAIQRVEYSYREVDHRLFYIHHCLPASLLASPVFIFKLDHSCLMDSHILLMNTHLQCCASM